MKQFDSKELYLGKCAKNSAIAYFLWSNTITIPEERIRINLCTTQDKMVRITEILDDAKYVIRTYTGDAHRGVVLKHDLCKTRITFVCNGIYVCIKVISPEAISEISDCEVNGVYITKNELEVLKQHLRSN